ncbi:MAG: class I SAM-dependent methyltransferase [Myxococcota bacterium]
MLTVRPDRLGLRPGMSVLDVGCGDGRHMAMTRRVPGVAAVGVDVGEAEVRGTEERLRVLDALPPDRGGSVDGAGPWMVMRGSIYELPFPDACFDRVIVSEVLEHLHDDRRALVEVSRVLAPGGVLAVSVPREGPEAVCWALSREYRNTPGGHVRIYRRRALRRLIAEAGYRVYGSHFAHGLHAPYWWLKCLVGPSRDDVKAVQLFHRLLVWDLMHRPWLTRALEGALVPLVGKSVVMYATKEQPS